MRGLDERVDQRGLPGVQRAQHGDGAHERGRRRERRGEARVGPRDADRGVEAVPDGVVLPVALALGGLRRRLAEPPAAAATHAADLDAGRAPGRDDRDLDRLRVLFLGQGLHAGPVDVAGGGVVALVLVEDDGVGGRGRRGGAGGGAAGRSEGAGIGGGLGGVQGVVVELLLLFVVVEAAVVCCGCRGAVVRLGRGVGFGARVSERREGG